MGLRILTINNKLTLMLSDILSIRLFTVSFNKDNIFNSFADFQPSIVFTIGFTAGKIKSSPVVCGFPVFAMSLQYSVKENEGSLDLFC